VSLPAGYDPGRRYAVFYLLHGLPGRPMAFILNAHIVARTHVLVRKHRIPPMILVYPDGRVNGNSQSDSEWANTHAGRFESYVIDVSTMSTGASRRSPTDGLV
jgi:enterochelin esterase-like enzyme